MMGSRGYLSAAEWDAFSRRARRIVPFRPGEIRYLKRKFWKRQRKEAKATATDGLVDSISQGDLGEPTRDEPDIIRGKAPA
jgi:hypothetical protein